MTPDELARLHRLSFTLPRPWSAAEFEALTAQPQVILLAEGEAFLLGRVIADEAEILTLAVPPDRRRNGSGLRLACQFLDRAAALGAATVFLEVASGNIAAQALYARAGFLQTGRRRGYFSDGAGRTEDALVLSRKVGPTDAAALTKR